MAKTYGIVECVNALCEINFTKRTPGHKYCSDKCWNTRKRASDPTMRAAIGTKVGQICNAPCEPPCDRPNYQKGLCGTHYRWNCQDKDISHSIKSRLNKIIAFGEEKSLKTWTKDERCVISETTLTSRLKEGWDPEEALTTQALNKHPPQPPGICGNRLCLQEFEIKSLGKKRKYHCSNKCALIVRNTSPNAPRRKNTQEKRKCLFCENYFMVRPKSTQKFCDASCRNKAKRRPVGSRWQHPKGYVWVTTPDGKWLQEHRYVMECKLGSPLLAIEDVHHINGVKNDNRPENLQVWRRYDQPRGQRAIDLLKWAREIEARYGPIEHLLV